MTGKVTATILGTTFAICYLLFFNYLEPYEVGIARNAFTGEIVLQKGGMHLTAPWVRVATIDTRPQRVCVTTTGRGFNCLLVAFDPVAYKEFVAVEGFRYYWWANRFSFNSGYHEEYRGMRDLLRGYAYSVKKYPFITIIRSYDE